MSLPPEKRSGETAGAKEGPGSCIAGDIGSCKFGERGFSPRVFLWGHSIYEEHLF